MGMARGGGAAQRAACSAATCLSGESCVRARQATNKRETNAKPACRRPRQARRLLTSSQELKDAVRTWISERSTEDATRSDEPETDSKVDELAYQFSGSNDLLREQNVVRSCFLKPALEKVDDGVVTGLRVLVDWISAFRDFKSFKMFRIDCTRGNELDGVGTGGVW